MKWDDYFISIAEAISKKSHCLSRQIGAVVVRDNKFIVSTGYNGPPSGYPHCDGDICPRHKLGYQSGEGLEICPASHAEVNSIVEAAKFGVSLKGCVLYLTGPYPCRECSKSIINSGIKEIVITSDDNYPDIGLSGKKILKICGIQIRVIKEKK